MGGSIPNFRRHDASNKGSFSGSRPSARSFCKFFRSPLPGFSVGIAVLCGSTRGAAAMRGVLPRDSPTLDFRITDSYISASRTVPNGGESTALR